MRSRLGASLLLSAVVVPVSLAAQKTPKVAETAVVAAPTRVAQVLTPAVAKPGWSYAVALTGRSGPMQMQAVTFEYDVKSPRDLASGQASGRRQYRPLIIVKEIDKASPMLARALATRDSAPDMTVHAIGPNGAKHDVTISNVQVSDIQKVTRLDSSGRPHEYEQVSFTYQKITFDNKAKPMASDDWVK